MQDQSSSEAEKIAERGEFDLIARHFAPLAAMAPGALGLTDDAALIDVPIGKELVVTMDGTVAGVHFLADDPPALIARKLLRVNLSDLAAMGAIPVAYTLCAAFPNDVEDAWVAAFSEGLALDQTEFSVALIGGDTVSTPGPATFTVTAMGIVDAGQALRRNGAGEGDDIYVSGTIGDGALGLRVLQEQDHLAELESEHKKFLAGRYRLPQPRVVLGPALVGLASAALDISDGLVGDLEHICETSGLGARVEASRVPLSDAGRRAVELSPSALATIVGGGDDYELLFTAPAKSSEEIYRRATAAGVPVTCIGRMVAGSGVNIVDAGGNLISVEAIGYRHF